MTTLTYHAQVRMQQRGIPPLIVQWLLEFGASEVSHGAVRRYFDKRARKRLASHVGHQVVDRLGDLLDLYVVEGDGRLVTAGHRTKRFHRR